MNESSEFFAEPQPDPSFSSRTDEAESLSPAQEGPYTQDVTAYFAQEGNFDVESWLHQRTHPTDKPTTDQPN